MYSVAIVSQSVPKRRHLHVSFVASVPASRLEALTYPVSLEAILTAEVGFLAQLLAVGTLEAAGIVRTVGAFAFALLVHCCLLGRCLVHGCGRSTLVVRGAVGEG